MFPTSKMRPQCSAQDASGVGFLPLRSTPTAAGFPFRPGKLLNVPLRRGMLMGVRLRLCICSNKNGRRRATVWAQNPPDFGPWDFDAPPGTMRYGPGTILTSYGLFSAGRLDRFSANQQLRRGI